MQSRVDPGGRSGDPTGPAKGAEPATCIATILLLCISTFLARLLRCKLKWKQRHDTAAAALCKLPVRQRSLQRTASTSDTCCICLESVTTHDRLRVLPCGHELHT